MTNSNDQAFPLTIITKREQTCIDLGIPESGTDWLDDLIRKSERKKIAAQAMQGMLAGGELEAPNHGRGIAKRALMYADALLAALADKEGE